MSGPQTLHSHPVPRIGGVGIVLGTVMTLTLLWLLHGSEAGFGLKLVACAAPTFPPTKKGAAGAAPSHYGLHPNVTGRTG